MHRIVQDDFFCNIMCLINKALDNFLNPFCSINLYINHNNIYFLYNILYLYIKDDILIVFDSLCLGQKIVSGLVVGRKIHVFSVPSHIFCLVLECAFLPPDISKFVIPFDAAFKTISRLECNAAESAFDMKVFLVSP